MKNYENKTFKCRQCHYSGQISPVSAVRLLYLAYPSCTAVKILMLGKKFFKKSKLHLVLGRKKIKLAIIILTR